MLVEATQPGFIAKLYKPGERFEIREDQFSEKWMRRIDEPPKRKRMSKKKQP